MSTTSQPFKEGKIPFKIPSRDIPCETYYKIYGDIRNTGPTPLIVLHGGPGSGHEYMEPYKQIWPDYGIPVVFYDQIGCASCTHLPETMGDSSFWQPSLFADELENLIKSLDLDRNDGPADQKAIEEAIQVDDFTGPAYLKAMETFRSTFLCRARPYPPPELAVDMNNQNADTTVRRTMQGRCPFLYNGSLEHYSNIPLLPKINVPTLVFNGEFDTATYTSVAKFFEHIPKVRWVTLPGASHMPHLDSPEMLEKTLKLVGEFLRPQSIAVGTVA